MTNREIAKKFNLLSKLMELHDENAFKVKSYGNAYLNIRKIPTELFEQSKEQIEQHQGIGKAISQKIVELKETGEIQEINKYLEITPIGIVDMLSIKGFGPKKIKLIWKELEIESIGELLYAVNENRLVDLKGFGAKTQSSLKEQLEYYLESTDKHLYASAEIVAKKLLDELKSDFPDELFSLTGEMHRRCTIVDKIEILTSCKKEKINTFCAQKSWTDNIEQLSINNFALKFNYSEKADFYYILVKTSTEESFYKKINIENRNYENEEQVFIDNELPFYIPEFREKENVDHIDLYRGSQNIINIAEIKGCIHNHSTYSDGVNSIEEMLIAAEKKEYEYFVITDHSKSAFYANGLSVERIYQQLDEIREVDQKYDDIRLFSGIESDILSNGDLDYEEEVLGDLDIIVASIHSNLKMDKNKATDRLLKAIENPFTSILGHPTGRLLLSRKAYPIDHKKVIDACADNFVAIELNANPLRLDMDWRWIQYAIQKDVLISINPDAHSIKGIDDIEFGVYAARKAGLPISHCLNAFDIDSFEDWLSEQHDKRR